jgi:tetratricopeptide (TPR) repeat protein
MYFVFKRLFLLAMAVLTVFAVFSLSACSKDKQERSSGDTTLSPRFASETQMLETALKDDPKNLNALIQLGNIYYDWGQNEVDTKGDTAQPEDKWLRAIKYYGQALEIDPSNSNVRVDMANLMRFMGRTDESLSHYRTAISQDPKHVQARINLITALGQQKQDYKGAISEYDALLMAVPEQKDNAALKQEVDNFRSMMKENKK